MSPATGDFPALEVDNISCSEAWELLSNEEDSYLIDVRTQEEWTFTGHPDLSSLNKKLIMLSFRLFPDMARVTSFESDLDAILKQDRNAKLLFICRSGARSYEAAVAMKKLGYQNCFNLVEGFEGGLNNSMQRNSVCGWKFNKLPWRQS